MFEALWCSDNNDEPRGRLKGRAAMYRAYFFKRLMEALSLAQQADSEAERAIHLRVSRFYRELIGADPRHPSV